MTPSATRTIDSIIAKLASLRLGVTLLVLTSIICIAGTLMDYETSINLIFNTWWFLSLLAFTSLSILCATWRTLTITIPNDHKPRFISNPEDIALLPAHFETQQALSQSDLTERLQKRGYQVFTEGNALYAMAGNGQRWGAVITHLGLVILLLGAVIQITSSFSGYLTLREGQSTYTFILAGTEKPVPLGFGIQLLDFEMKRHPNSNIPSQFTSTVQTEDGQSATIEVNRSYKHHGLVLHQNSYNLLPDVARYILEFRRATSDPAFIELNVGESVELDGSYILSVFFKNDGIHYKVNSNVKCMESLKPVDEGIIAGIPDYTLELLDFLPDFQLDKNMRPYSPDAELRNPAIRVLLREGGNEVGASWLFLRPELRGFSHKTLPLRMAFTGMASQKTAMPTTVLKLDDLMATVQILNPAIENQWIHNIPDVNKPFTTVTLMQGIPVAVFSQKQEILNNEKDTSPTALSSKKWVRKAQRIDAYSSTLGVTRSPGIPWIYFGCALLTIGPVVSFSISRRKIWAIFEENRTCIGGRSRVSNEALGKEISELSTEFIASRRL